MLVTELPRPVRSPAPQDKRGYELLIIFAPIGVPAAPGLSLRAGLREAAPYFAAMVTAALMFVGQIAAAMVWGEREGHKLRDLLMKWDADWLTSISDHGYLSVPGRVPAESVAFFPGYPTLVRVVAAPLHIFGVDESTLIAALLVSVAACIALACGLTRLAIVLAQRWQSAPIGLPTQLALAVAVTVTALGAPMGVIYAMPYSEALFTALAVWALVALIERRYLLAAGLVLFAGLTRLTAIALVATLCVAAIVELWRYWRGRRADHRPPVPWQALAAPMIGASGLLAYLAWASYRTASLGGYFAVQDAGWGSGWDFGRATWDWLAHNTTGSLADATKLGFVITSWAMIAALALPVFTVWPLIRGWFPWQLWVTAVAVAGIVLGSGGTMHARPRLLLPVVLLLLVPLVVRLVVEVANWDAWRRWAGCAATAALGVAWCALGVAVSGTMLIDFKYGI